MNAARPENDDQGSQDVPQPKAPSQPAHPSQAEGEDPQRNETHPDPRTGGHPSQAEGGDGSGS